MITNDDASMIASGWHSVMTWNDPGVAMYSVTSTGKIHSEKHRKQLIAYIEKQIPHAVDMDMEGEDPILMDSNLGDLDALKIWAISFRL